ncbi:MAG: hypothetical protein KGL46_07605 [Hyphomicrobiales bacterium]|nr:hypothetical protein [Hyphomicrobiales bacterium]
MLRKFLVSCAGLAIAAPAIVAPALAAPRSKARAHPPASVSIINQRSVSLTSFEIAGAGEDGKVIARLAKPLGAGKKASLPLRGANGCEFVARWQFEDAGDEANINLCHDPKIVLTD